MLQLYQEFMISEQKTLTCAGHELWAVRARIQRWKERKRLANQSQTDPTSFHLRSGRRYAAGDLAVQGPSRLIIEFTGLL